VLIERLLSRDSGEAVRQASAVTLAYLTYNRSVLLNTALRTPQGFMILVFSL